MQLFSMTWPVAVELLLTSLISTGSTYILNCYSQEAVAVVGSLSQIVSLVINLYTIISVGGSILLAPMVGAGKNKEAGKLIKTLLYSNLLFSGIVSIVTFVCIEPFMVWMHLDPSLYGMGREYLAVSLLLSVMQSLLITYVAIFRSFGRMKDVLVCNLMVYLVCLGVNVIIYYMLPDTVQSMGLYTLAGIIGQGSGVLYLHLRLGIFFWKKNGQVRLERSTWRDILWKVLRLGTFGGLEGVFYLIIQAMVVSLIGQLGTQALLVKAYLTTFATYMVICNSALGVSVFPLTGQHMGERDFDALRRTHRDGCIAGILLTALVGAIMILLSRPILLCFTTQEAVIQQVQYMLYIQYVLELIRVPVSLIVVGLKGVGEVRVPFWIMVGAGILNFFVSWLFGIRLQMGLPGIWAGYYADLLFRLAVGGYFMLRILRNPQTYLAKLVE